MKNLTGIGLGNPFPMRRPNLRDLVLKKFSRHFDKCMGSKTGELYTAVSSVYEIMIKEPVQLTCFCKPQSCHCDIIASFLNTAYYKAHPDSEVDIYNKADMIVIPYYHSGHDYVYKFNILYDAILAPECIENITDQLVDRTERVVLAGYNANTPIYGISVFPTNADANIHALIPSCVEDFAFSKIAIDIDFLQRSFDALLEVAELNEHISYTTPPAFASVLSDNLKPSQINQLKSV